MRLRVLSLQESPQIKIQDPVKGKKNLLLNIKDGNIFDRSTIVPC